MKFIECSFNVSHKRLSSYFEFMNRSNILFQVKRKSATYKLTLFVPPCLLLETSPAHNTLVLVVIKKNNYRRAKKTCPITGLTPNCFRPLGPVIVTNAVNYFGFNCLKGNFLSCNDKSYEETFYSDTLLNDLVCSKSHITKAPEPIKCTHFQ